MKKFLFVLLIALVIVGGYLFIKKDNTLGGWSATQNDLVGSITNLVSLPNEAVFASATTTAPSGENRMADGGELVSQDVVTEGVDKVKLYIMAKGDTATSTVFVRHQVSYNGVNFADIATSTTARLNATTTYDYDKTLMSISFTPGLATTTRVFEFDTTGYAFSRFIIWNSNLASDPADGVQAYIKAVKINN